MSQTRRLFLTTLFRAGAAIPFVPILGESVSVFIDSTKVFVPRLTETQIIDLELRRIRTMIPALFDKDDTFLIALANHVNDHFMLVNKDIRVPLILKPGGKF